MRPAYHRMLPTHKSIGDVLRRSSVILDQPCTVTLGNNPGNDTAWEFGCISHAFTIAACTSTQTFLRHQMRCLRWNIGPRRSETIVLWL